MSNKQFILVKDIFKRKDLREGRTTGIAISFLKDTENFDPSTDAKVYETYMPFSPCKDYINDFIYVEKTKKLIKQIHGFRHHKVTNLFDDTEFITIGITSLPNKVAKTALNNVGPASIAGYYRQWVPQMSDFFTHGSNFLELLNNVIKTYNISEHKAEEISSVTSYVSFSDNDLTYEYLPVKVYRVPVEIVRNPAMFSFIFKVVRDHYTLGVTVNEVIEAIKERYLKTGALDAILLWLLIQKPNIVNTIIDSYHLFEQEQVYSGTIHSTGIVSCTMTYINNNRIIINNDESISSLKKERTDLLKKEVNIKKELKVKPEAPVSS